LESSNQEPATQGTNGSQEHYDGPSINPEDVILELPSMYANADTILKLLVKCGSRDDIETALSDPNSKIKQRLQQSQEQFVRQRTILGSTDYFVVPQLIEKTLFDNNAEAFAFAQAKDISLNDIIYKINLAAFLYMLCEWHDYKPDDEMVRDSIQFSDEMFPVSFLSHLIDEPENDNTIERLPTGTSAIKGATLGLAASLRSQIAILHIKDAMAESQGADPAIILREVFYDTTGIANSVRTKELLEQQPLRPWHFGNPLSAADANQIRDFVDLIDHQLPDQSDASAFEGNNNEQELHWIVALDESFSWPNFVIDSAEWTQQRARELTVQIQLRGGVEEIVNLVERLRTEDPSTVQPSQRFIGISPSNLTTPQKESQHLMTDQAQVMDTPTRQNLDLYNQLQSFAARALTPGEQRIPSLLDSQPNGQKVTFQDTQPAPAQSKRRRRQDDDEVSQDDGFKKKRGNHLTSTQASPFRSSDLGLNASAAAGPSVAQGTQQTQASEPLAGSQFDEPVTQSAQHLEFISQNYEAVKRAGKDIAEHRKAELKSEDDRKVQERKRWTKEETTALIAYIEEIGTSWAMIQKTDQARGANLLLGRDQVALKDKARNLKFEYMKANAAVPKNFEAVSLSKSMRDKLAAWNGAVPQNMEQA
jgi:hypothetical protein